jgi:hypothetical protein
MNGWGAVYLGRDGAPHLAPHLLKNFVIAAPLQSHWRPATCEEAGCRKWRHGFEIRLDTSDPDPRAVARLKYLRDGGLGKRFTEWREPGQTVVVFRFPAGTRVPGHENEHRIRVARPEIFAVRDPRSGLYVHQGRGGGADDWVDQFANHQDKLADAHRKG